MLPIGENGFRCSFIIAHYILSNSSFQLSYLILSKLLHRYYGYKRWLDLFQSRHFHNI